MRRFAVRRKYSEGGIEVITDEDDDDKDTEDESNNNLDEIDKLVLDVVKENVRDIRTAGTPFLGATSVQFTQIQIEITKRLESEKLLEITLDTYQLLSCTNARDITVLVKRAMGKNDYGEYFNDSNIIPTKTVTPTNNRFPSVRLRRYSSSCLPRNITVINSMKKVGNNLTRKIVCTTIVRLNGYMCWYLFRLYFYSCIILSL